VLVPSSRGSSSASQVDSLTQSKVPPEPTQRTNTGTDNRQSLNSLTIGQVRQSALIWF